MSKPEFTPAPWTFTSPEKNVNNPTVCGQLVGTFEIYSAHETAWIAQVLSLHNPRGKANKALILKAPDLYAALQDAVLGFKVLRAVLEKAGLQAGSTVAQQHIENFENLLKEARDEK